MARRSGEISSECSWKAFLNSTGHLRGSFYPSTRQDHVKMGDFLRTTRQITRQEASGEPSGKEVKLFVYMYNLVGNLQRMVSRTNRNPSHEKLPPEPGQLAFGKLVGADFDQGNGVIEGANSVQMLDHLPITQGLERCLILRQAGIEESPGFFDQTTLEH